MFVCSKELEKVKEEGDFGGTLFGITLGESGILGLSLGSGDALGGVGCLVGTNLGTVWLSPDLIVEVLFVRSLLGLASSWRVLSISDILKVGIGGSLWPGILLKSRDASSTLSAASNSSAQSASVKSSCTLWRS